MASISGTLSTATLPELKFPYPISTSRSFRLPLRSRIKASKRDENVVLEEKDVELMRKVNGNGNGSVKKNGELNGALMVDKYSNGSVGKSESENESLVKYVNGNVNGNGVAARSAEKEVVVEVKVEEVVKKSIDEIGQEEAWFKKNKQVEVSVPPGGRWNRFKTYSTIQRTLEIWGSVFTFLFKAWLNNQKFSYRGGMTEAKKTERRKVLARWLKETILRLGPTFIKIGQQFSTRVDILAQEYVDQLSELQRLSNILSRRHKQCVELDRLLATKITCVQET